MTRFGVLTTLVVVGALVAAAGAQQGGQLPRAKVRAIQKIKDNLYWIPGSDRNTYPVPGSGYDASARTATTGGNTAVFVMDTGVVLVDTMNPGSGPEILAQVQSVTNKPVTTIINTHNHFDHSGSNTEFPVSVETVVHENARANLAQAKCPPVTHCEAYQGENAKFLPRRTYKDKLTLFQGKDRVELYHFGRGHTNGDTFVVFPAVRAMHTGDMFQRKNMPFIDVTNNGGNALEFTQTLNRAASTIKGVETVVPGHSPTLMTWNDFKEYTEYYGEFVASIRKSMKAGKSVDEAASGYKPSAKYEKYETEAGRVKQNAESIYASSKGTR
ncbi:MAG TPA: MBL fold metallo-hydrolase [Vicinamibacterales bacterium]|jgi:glyoxylase-like metal-dependent hydrolase (beta-lactamase superfamily II)|nr:MBL fold metallo-hydrolase [Vicinamibacterales bacterium]